MDSFTLLVGTTEAALYKLLKGNIPISHYIKQVASLIFYKIRYDVKTNTWEMLPSMSIGRYGIALAVFLGKIFVIGGFSENYQSSVECYDPLTNSWTSVASMNEQRFGAQAGVSGGCLYVVGGRKSDIANHSSIERYDHQTHMWTVVNIDKCSFNIIHR